MSIPFTDRSSSKTKKHIILRAKADVPVCNCRIVRSAVHVLVKLKVSTEFQVLRTTCGLTGRVFLKWPSPLKMASFPTLKTQFFHQFFHLLANKREKFDPRRRNVLDQSRSIYCLGYLNGQYLLKPVYVYPFCLSSVLSFNCLRVNLKGPKQLYAYGCLSWPLLLFCSKEFTVIQQLVSFM